MTQEIFQRAICDIRGCILYGILWDSVPRVASVRFRVMDTTYFTIRIGINLVTDTADD